MKILVAGDFCPQYRVAELFEKGDFAAVLGEVKPSIEQADYSIVNFECPITKGGESPIEKCGPNLQCSECGMDAVKWAGFSCVTLANNHFLDYGEEGVANTLDACQKYGIDVVGGGRNLQEAARILYKEINGQTLAVINCCEHEFSIATKNTAGSNPLNPIQQYYAIQEAKQKADYVLVIVHGGNEHYQLPSPRMQETYRFFVDAGADAVVNHHQHCYSGYETYKGKPIFYGLGNFCFDKNRQMQNTWYDGYMVGISFTQQDVEFEMLPYYNCKGNARVVLYTNEEQEGFKSVIKELNQIICKENILLERYEHYIKGEKIDYLFEPYYNRILTALYNRHLLPSLVSKRRKLLLLSYIQCESHITKVINKLRS